MEYIREIKITVEIDTNKRTESRVFIMQDHENLKEFLDRIREEAQQIAAIS